VTKKKKKKKNKPKPIKIMLGMVAHAYNPSCYEDGIQEDVDQPGQTVSEILSQTVKIGGHGDIS
jgi:hypothetical protein